MPVIMTPEEHDQAVYLLGPWLIGSFIDVLFQGVLFCQFAHYLSLYRDDKLTVRLSVLGLAILTTLKSVQSIALIWVQNILYFKDLQGAILLNYTTWWQSGNPLMVACIGLYVQIFFLHRLYGVSAKKKWVVTPIAIVLAFAFVSICLATYFITFGESAGPKIAAWFAAHFSSVCAGDLAMCFSIAFFLIRSKRDVLPQTVGIITSLIRLTFSTMAPAALCAMMNLIFSQVYSGSDRLVSTAFNMVLPKLYAFSMMWTLNARRSMRTGGSRVYSGENSSAPRRPRDNVELNTYNGVQVHTHTETSIDVRKMFHGDESKSGESQATSIPDYKISAM
ncbi:hypothetical protein AMATHDRAFT_3327 [Amanita thiersii Skay4041]|uniref:DUF6534 domain-containing protein n=1 Tax=Amanita thiersii Skay4041 TaxID=703135 RepID=A0A2A9NM73_9AGAR|nr:hypothetical protein AMATHDRAFT_3327 [Amanita thiersii Skay4041]